MSADADEGSSDVLVEPADPNVIILNYRPDDDEFESIHESSDDSKNTANIFNAEVATIINSHGLEVMEESKEEPSSGEGRNEVDIKYIEPEANTPDVGSMVTAESHSERELNA